MPDPIKARITNPQAPSRYQNLKARASKALKTVAKTASKATIPVILATVPVVNAFGEDVIGRKDLGIVEKGKTAVVYNNDGSSSTFDLTSSLARLRLKRIKQDRTEALQHRKNANQSRARVKELNASIKKDEQGIKDVDKFSKVRKQTLVPAAKHYKKTGDAQKLVTALAKAIPDVAASETKFDDAGCIGLAQFAKLDKKGIVTEDKQGKVHFHADKARQAGFTVPQTKVLSSNSDPFKNAKVSALQKTKVTIDEKGDLRATKPDGTKASVTFSREQRKTPPNIMKSEKTTTPAVMKSIQSSAPQTPKEKQATPQISAKAIAPQNAEPKVLTTNNK